jgi:hypothetical protein
MLKVTFFDCTINKSGDTIRAINKAIEWFKNQGITFESEIIIATGPIGKDFETLITGFGSYDILNDNFYGKTITKYIQGDTDICIFCYEALGRNAINLSEPTNVYKMVCAQAIMDNGES